MIGCGTTTSGRVRDIVELHNSFHYLEGTREALQVKTYAYAESEGFMPRRHHRFGPDLQTLAASP
jgi:hypothetical protein